MPLRKLASLSRIESFNQSNLAVGKRKKIYLEHIGRIVYASEIENISEIIAIKSISSNYREGILMSTDEMMKIMDEIRE